MKKILYILLLLCCVSSIWADHKNRSEYGGNAANYLRMNVRMLEDIKRDTANTFWNRIAVQTNLVDWMLLAPNFTVGYDLGDPFKTVTPTLMLGARMTIPKLEYNTRDYSYQLLAFRGEVRWHYRHNELRSQWKGTQYVTLGARKYTMMMLGLGDKYDQQTEYVQSLSLRGFPEKIKGRWYSGIYAEYVHNFEFTTPKEKYYWPSGKAFMTGWSAGYELPHFNFNNKLQMNWDFGFDAGVVVSPHQKLNVFPLVSDLRVGINFRKHSMRMLYWKPDLSQYARNAEFNKETELRADMLRALIDSITVNIEVTPVANDSDFIETLTQRFVASEIKRQLDLKSMRVSHFKPEEISTKFPIAGRKLSENYSMQYDLPRRTTYFYGQEMEHDTIRIYFPFHVRLKGYNEGDSLYNKFETAVQQWRDSVGGFYPTAYRTHLDKEHVTGYLSKSDIIELFDSVTHMHLDSTQITGIYYKEDDVQYAVNEIDVNRRLKKGSYYSLGLKFHPQWVMDSSAVATRFVIDFSDAKTLQGDFAKLARYFSSGSRIYIERPWVGKDTVPNPVRPEEIIAAIRRQTNDSINFLKPEMFTIEQPMNKFGNANLFDLSYDVLFNTIADRRVIIEDSVGRNNAIATHKLIQERGDYGAYYRDYDYMSESGEEYPTFYLEDFTQTDSITAEMVASAMTWFYGVDIEPYQVVMPLYKDANGNASYSQPWRQHPDTFRGMALIRLHREYPTNIRFYYRVKQLSETNDDEIPDYSKEEETKQ